MGRYECEHAEKPIFRSLQYIAADELYRGIPKLVAAIRSAN